jgi:tape measure domain-containing protein
MGSDLRSKLVIEGDTSGASSAVNKLTSSLQNLKSLALGALGLDGLAQSVKTYANTADSVNNLTARLRLLDTTGSNLRETLTQLNLIANRNQVSISDLGQTYFTVANGLRQFKGDSQAALQITEAVTAALRISGTTGEQASAALLQFGQGLRSNFQGDEFRSITENAPRLLDAVAAGLGKSTSELKKMSSEGKLTGDVVGNALIKQLGVLKNEAASLPQTVGGSFELVKNAFFNYIKATDEATGKSRTMAAVLRTIADNLPAIIDGMTKLGLIIGALGFARLAASMAAYVTVTAAATAGTSLLAGATAFLMGLIGGPVGLVVLLGTLAAAWFLAGKSADDYSKKSSAALQANKAALQEKAKSAFYNRAALLDEVKQIDDELAKRGADDEFTREARRGQSGASTLGGLKSALSLEQLANDFKTATSIRKKYADDIKKIDQALANDRERAAGDPIKIREYERDAAEKKKAAQKERDDGLNSLVKNGITTRIEQYKAEYQQTLELAGDAISREKALNDQRYQNNLKSLQAYFADKNLLDEEQFAIEREKLEYTLRREKAVLKENEARATKAKTANEKDAFKEANFASAQKILETETALLKLGRDRADTASINANEQERALRAMKDQLADLQLQSKQYRGTDTLGDHQAAAERQLRPALELLKREGQDGLATQILDDAKNKQAIDFLEQAYNRLYASLQSSEAELQNLRDRGLLTTEETQNRMLQGRAGAIPQLEELLNQLRAIAATAGPETQQRVVQLGQKVDDLKRPIDTLNSDIKRAATSELANFFVDLGNSATSAGDKIKALAANFAKAVAQIIAQRLALKAVEAIASAYGFHSGGVVGSGQGFQRRGLDAGIFAVAPRYHSGGIAGLGPNEVPAVLQKGEEVITARDPRHRNNRGTMLGDVNLSVTINGASDTSQAPAAAQDLKNVIDGAIGAWAIRQSRPGGMLHGSR